MAPKLFISYRPDVFITYLSAFAVNSY